jgi:hypothetical protein
MIFRGIWSQEEVGFFMADLCIENGAAQENERSHRIGERVMPAKGREGRAELLFQAKILNEIAKRKGIFFRPDSSGKLESIHPGSKSMKRESAEEAPLGSGAMGDKPAIMQEVVDPGPELRQSRCARKILGANAVDVLGCPGDRLFRKKEAAKFLTNLKLMHQRDPDLYGHLGTSSPNAGALEIDCRERDLGDCHAVRPNAARRSFGSGILLRWARLGSRRAARAWSPNLCRRP